MVKPRVLLHPSSPWSFVDETTTATDRRDLQTYGATSPSFLPSVAIPATAPIPVSVPATSFTYEYSYSHDYGNQDTSACVKTAMDTTTAQPQDPQMEEGEDVDDGYILPEDRIPLTDRDRVATTARRRKQSKRPRDDSYDDHDYETRRRKGRYRDEIVPPSTKHHVTSSFRAVGRSKQEKDDDSSSSDYEEHKGKSRSFNSQTKRMKRAVAADQEEENHQEESRWFLAQQSPCECDKGRASTNKEPTRRQPNEDVVTIVGGNNENKVWTFLKSMRHHTESSERDPHCFHDCHQHEHQQRCYRTSLFSDQVHEPSQRRRPPFVLVPIPYYTDVLSFGQHRQGVQKRKIQYYEILSKNLGKFLLRSEAVKNKDSHKNAFYCAVMSSSASNKNDDNFFKEIVEGRFLQAAASAMQKQQHLKILNKELKLFRESIVDWCRDHDVPVLLVRNTKRNAKHFLEYNRSNNMNNEMVGVWYDKWQGTEEGTTLAASSSWFVVVPAIFVRRRASVDNDFVEGTTAYNDCELKLLNLFANKLASPPHENRKNSVQQRPAYEQDVDHDEQEDTQDDYFPVPEPKMPNYGHAQQGGGFVEAPISVAEAATISSSQRPTDWVTVEDNKTLVSRVTQTTSSSSTRTAITGSSNYTSPRSANDNTFNSASLSEIGCRCDSFRGFASGTTDSTSASSAVVEATRSAMPKAVPSYSDHPSSLQIGGQVLPSTASSEVHKHEQDLHEVEEDGSSGTNSSSNSAYTSEEDDDGDSQIDDSSTDDDTDDGEDEEDREPATELTVFTIQEEVALTERNLQYLTKRQAVIIKELEEAEERLLQMEAKTRSLQIRTKSLEERQLQQISLQEQLQSSLAKSQKALVRLITGDIKPENQAGYVPDDTSVGHTSSNSDSLKTLEDMMRHARKHENEL